MFEGQRLSYLVPGYTGYIPEKHKDDYMPKKKFDPTSHIPGYAGYVHSIKSENLYANTYGKITHKVNNDHYIRGQDLATRDKYITTQTDTNIPPSEMLHRTAAEIVGVPNKRIVVREPVIGERAQGTETDQFTQVKGEQFRQSMRNAGNKWAQTTLTEREGKEYVQLGNPLPGYTGFGKRVVANNIFGRTYAECRNDSLVDADKMDHDRKKNFNTQLNSDPPLKF